MTLKQFIKDHKDEIDKAIRDVLKDTEYRINNHERRLWILNDESLYNWARSEGCRI